MQIDPNLNSQTTHSDINLLLTYQRKRGKGRVGGKQHLSNTSECELKQTKGKFRPNRTEHLIQGDAMEHVSQDLKPRLILNFSKLYTDP